MRLRDLVRDRLVWLLVAIVLAFFYEPLTTGTFYFRDLYQLFYPIKKFLADSGTVPLWDPLRHGGTPFLASPPYHALYPSTILYFVLPPLLAFNLALVLQIVLCAIAAYWLARTLGLTAAPAFVAGAAFAFCGFTLSEMNLPSLFGLPWIPLTLGLTHRALRDRRSLAPAAIAAAMPLYGASPELTAMLFATIVVWVAAARLDVSHRTKAIAIAVVIVGGIGLSCVQTLPALSVIAQSSRSAKRSYEAFSSWSVHPRRLPELIVPQYLGDTGSMDTARYRGHDLESRGFPYILSIYLGVPVLLLAAIGAGSRTKREMPAWALTLLAAAGIVLSLGRALPFFHFLYEHVPLVAIFRFPVKTQILSLLPVALLAAYGAERVSRSRGARIAAAVAGIAVAIGAAIAALATSDASLAFSFAHCAAAAVAIAIAVWRSVLVPAVVLLDLLVAGAPVNRYAPRSLYDEPPLAALTRQVVRDGRFYAPARKLQVKAPTDDLMWLARWQLETLADYTAALYDIRVIYHEDYDGLAERRIARVSEIIERLPWRHRRALLDRAGVRAFITPDVVAGFQEVARVRGLHVYANPSAPMARFVSSIDVATRELDALQRVVNARTLDRAVLERSVRVGDCGVAVVRHVAQNRYEVDAPCRGLVVFAEPHYDGWRAFVDGRRVEEVRADYAFTAVPVEKGRHVIERTYRPPLLIAGCLATMAAAGLLFFVRRITS